jgi:DDE family transposase
MISRLAHSPAITAAAITGSDRAPEHARDVARSFAGTESFEQSRHQRTKIEVRFAHLKRILRLGPLRLRGSRGAQDEFVLAAIAQNLRRLAALVARPPPVQPLCIASRRSCVT